MKRKIFRKSRVILAALLCSAAAAGTVCAAAGVYEVAEASTGGKTKTQALNWIKNQLGKGQDYDGFAGVQCTDLIQMYANYLGQKLPAVKAYEYITCALPSGWKRYNNTKAPKAGDIFIYDKGKFGAFGIGHVGVILEVDKTGYTCVDYNWNDKLVATKRHVNGRNSFSYVIRPDFPSTSTKKNGWFNEGGGYKYYKNGSYYTGWHLMSKAEGEKTNHWSYFGKDGKVYTGWHYMSKAEGEKNAHWSYFGDNGWMRTGWQAMGKGTSNSDGSTTKHWSFFGDNGWLRTGWQEMGKGTKNPDGNAAKHWSYFGDNGWLRTGWLQMGKGTKEPDGNKAKHWSYFGTNGWMRTGLVTLGKADGESVAHKSYFGNNGWLVVNKKFTLAGKTYTADSRGWVR